ncbi:hypothetical protein FBULB1_14155 [Fusarium bulbicola]|nr:hypothetical protein FBULB1_14155 [Fusarium bulbicola]
MSGENQLQNTVCVDASLCQLCRFPINRERENIVVLTPDEQVSSPFNIYSEEDDGPPYINKSLNMSFRHCVYPYCKHSRGLAVTFHAKCVDMVAPFGTPLHEWRLITKPSYRHVSLSHESRRGRVRESIEVSLHKTYGKLPPEIWHVVSGDDELIRLYSIAELSLQHRKTEWSVDLSLPVLITVVRMVDVENLYISSDHLGIRQVTLDPNEATSDTAYPSCWQTVSVNNPTLTFQSDGLKLRKLLTPSIYPRVLWPRPVTLSELDSMTFYYAGWHFRRSTPWGFMKYKRDSDIALALVTSKGRNMVAGSFPDERSSQHLKHHHWNLVAKTSANAPLRVFFSPSDHGVPLIVAPRLLDNQNAAPSLRQTPLCTMPRFNPLRTIRYSSASLENITEVLVCKSKNQKDMGVIEELDWENRRLITTPYRKVTGLLFRYADGIEASAGCFRFDWAETPLTRGDSMGLFFGTKPGQTARLPSHVAVVRVAPPEGGFTWLEVPWAGVLEWWFSPDSLDTRITHGLQ